MMHNFPPDMDPLERALIESKNAVDSRGLKVMLISPKSYSCDDLAAAALRTIHSLSVEGVVIGGLGPPSDPERAEMNRAHNIVLAANVLLQARVKQVKATERAHHMVKDC